MKKYIIIIVSLLSMSSSFAQEKYSIETNPGTPSSHYTLAANTDYSMHFNIFIETSATLNGFKTTFDGTHKLIWDLTSFEKNKWIEIAHDFSTTSEMVNPVLKIEMIDDVNTGLGSGTFYIDDIRIYDNTNLSIEELEDGLSIFPNPVENILTIQNLKPENNLLIYNLIGTSFKPKLNALGNNTYNLNMSSLASGVYFLKIKNENRILTKKIIKH